MSYNDEAPMIDEAPAPTVALTVETAAATRSAGADEAAARAVAEVQVQALMAMKNPRVVARCIADIMEDCKRFDFAKAATYAYKKGTTEISDGSIHLALAMANAWGNLDLRVKEIDRTEGASVIEARCWDLQKNVARRIEQVVPHKMKANNRIKELSDPRDIYELVFNYGSRRLRKCIFDVIPADVKRLALAQVAKTIELGPVDANGKPLQTVQQRTNTMVRVFRDFGVSVEMLEVKLGHAITLTTSAELVQLQAVFNSIRDGAPAAEFFGGAAAEGVAAPVGSADELRAKLHGEGK